MDFNGVIQFQIGTIKIHTLARYCQRTRNVQYLIFDKSSHHLSGKFQISTSV
jgi:hypothetical protein